VQQPISAVLGLGLGGEVSEWASNSCGEWCWCWWCWCWCLLALVLAWTVEARGPAASVGTPSSVKVMGHGSTRQHEPGAPASRWVHAGAASLFWCYGGRESWTCICRHAFPAGNLLSWRAQCPLHACDDMRRYATACSHVCIARSQPWDTACVLSLGCPAHPAVQDKFHPRDCRQPASWRVLADSTAVLERESRVHLCTCGHLSEC
jgi:hypothetical protein